MLVSKTSMIWMSTFNKAAQEEYNDMLGETDADRQKSETNAGTELAKYYKRRNFSFVCPKCLEAGVTRECEHFKMRAPAWQSEQRKAMVAWVNRGQQTTFEIETLGVVTGDGAQCFNRHTIEQLFAHARVSSEGAYVDRLFVAIDPCNGQHSASSKAKSEFCVLTMYHNDRYFVVVGVDSFPAWEPEHWEGPLVEHIRRVRAIPGLEHVPIIAFPENNTGTEAGLIRRVLMENFEGMSVVYEDNFRSGIKTTGSTKRDMMVVTRDVLNNYELRINKRLVTVQGDSESSLRKLKDQLLRYSEVTTPSLNPTKPPSITYSGKLNGALDDVATMLQFNLYCAKLVYSNHPAFAIDRRSAK